VVVRLADRSDLPCFHQHLNGYLFGGAGFSATFLTAQKITQRVQVGHFLLHLGQLAADQRRALSAVELLIGASLKNFTDLAKGKAYALCLLDKSGSLSVCGLYSR
jgi:hypothetical protein